MYMFVNVHGNINSLKVDLCTSTYHPSNLMAAYNVYKKKHHSEIPSLLILHLAPPNFEGFS